MSKLRSYGYIFVMAGALAGLTASMTGQSKPPGEVDLVGYAHTDLSWLWPRSETIHEVLPRTIESVLKMMQDHPGMVYAMSAAQAYKWTERYYPDLFAEISKKIASGEWEVVGGSWTEHSTNIPSGESLVRQHLYAKRYFKEKFGVDVKTAWLPDSFGFNWNLPQIYQKCGMNYFVTFKLQWQIERNNPPVPFPYHLFWWEGPDGSRVLSFLTVGSYGEDVQPAKLLEALKTLETTQHVDKLLVLYGKGDHGGGPMPDMMDRAVTLMHDPTYPTVRFTKGVDYFREIQALPQAKDLPVVDDELYVKTHRGTYTTDSQVKRDNRRCEVLLMNAEKFSLLASQFGQPYPQDRLQALWEKVLFGQTHDNIDGSAFAEVYRDAATDYADIKHDGGKILNSALSTISKQVNTQGEGRAVLIFNPLPWERTGLVTLDSTYFTGLDHFKISDAAGNAVPYQIEADAGTAKALFFAGKVPGMGYKEYRVAASAEQPPFPTDLTVSGLTLANSQVEVAIDPVSGNLTSLKRKSEERNFLREDKPGAALEVWEDKPANAPAGEPAWNINLGVDNKLDKAESVNVVETGPIRTVVQVKKSFGDSAFVENIVLYSHADCVDFELNVDWHEKYRFAKVAFPMNLNSSYATYEIPFGAIQRFDWTLKADPGVRLQAPPRAWEIADRTKFEVAGQRWADVSNQAGDYGVTLLNDSKYGFSYQDNTLRMSLIRGPRRGYPDMPDTWSDQSDEPIVGIHHIKYALIPHHGSWQDADATRRGAEFNEPLLPKSEPSHAGQLAASYSVLDVAPSSVTVESVKKAEDSSEYIVRLYEAADKPAIAALNFTRTPRTARETDMMEWDKFVPSTAFAIKGTKVIVPVRPFEVKTIRVGF
ncbi:MAG TPA: glycoside hydrolase family 38 C-terminal domain-containing protein [Terriglobia bacterium]|nr:glycoside hydrolase family 38 C-terminal domain-containing protein [Terriglobia bacterium]